MVSLPRSGHNWRLDTGRVGYGARAARTRATGATPALVKLVPGETKARLWRSVWSDTLLCMDLHTRLGVTTVRGAVQGEVQGAVQGAVRVGVDGGICGRTRRNGSCQLRRGIRATCARGGARRVSGTGSGVRETRFNFQKVDIGTEEAIGIRKVLDERRPWARAGLSEIRARGGTSSSEAFVRRAATHPRPHPRVRCRATTVRRGGNTSVSDPHDTPHTHNPNQHAPSATHSVGRATTHVHVRRTV